MRLPLSEIWNVAAVKTSSERGVAKQVNQKWYAACMLNIKLAVC